MNEWLKFQMPQLLFSRKKNGVFLRQKTFNIPRNLFIYFLFFIFFIFLFMLLTSFTFCTLWYGISEPPVKVHQRVCVCGVCMMFTIMLP